jgi:hypothetical protein
LSNWANRQATRALKKGALCNRLFSMFPIYSFCFRYTRMF